MLKGIDHIVCVVPDLETAVRNYGELGFTVVRGGKHPIGTHNALIAFADGAYIELIAFLNPDARHPWKTALEKGGGLIDFCMQTDDLRGDVAAFRKAGAVIGDPAPLTRTRPDGYELKWVLAIPQAGFSGSVPFLIEDETPHDERVPREKAHRNGVTGIARLTIAVSNLVPVQGFYTSILGKTGNAVAREDLNARGLQFGVGPHVCEFLTPVGNGAIAEHLHGRGPSPFSAMLKTAANSKGVLAMDQTLGARFELV